MTQAMDAMGDASQPDSANYWSSSDYPYECMVDKARTTMLMAAVRASVSPGDVVVDAGAGTGVLSLTAAEAGARKVFAVEIDPLMSRALESTVRLNGFEDVITVIGNDIREVDLPRADVVIAELIDTGLIDEQLVPVLRSLRQRGVIADGTTVLPNAYRTTIRLVDADNRFHGFQIAAIRHEWPHYSGEPDRWLSPPVTAVTDRLQVWSADLLTMSPDETVSFEISLELPHSVRVNGVRIEGTEEFGAVGWTGSYPSLNASKLLPLEPTTLEGSVTLRGGWRLGGGLSTVWLRIDDRLAIQAL